jgi:FMN phosphatase YigB (HAD superfamily)
MKRLLITDLDNTLYDWVTFYALSFGRMVDELVVLLSTSRDQLLNEFKVIHQRYENSEQPFAALELPTVLERFPEASRMELANRLAPAFEVFNRSRKQTLHLYAGVAETLRALNDRGIKVVGHTEALAVNAWYRLRTLDVAPLLSRLYALEGKLLPHPVPGREAEHARPDEIVRVIPRSERKPNPRLLLDVCEREDVLPRDACYIGDSLTRDISMAKHAGVTAVWARYGLSYDPTLWDILVRVTHWTPEGCCARGQTEERRRTGFARPYDRAFL